MLKKDSFSGVFMEGAEVFYSMWLFLGNFLTFIACVYGKVDFL